MEDDYKVEYHLTQIGWVIGTSYYFDKLQGSDISRPTDTVETWIYHETQSSMYGKADVNWTRIWKNPNVKEKDIEMLHRQFPKDLSSKRI